MDKSITITEVRDNLTQVSDSMRNICVGGTFKKFSDNEKDMFNRMKILLDNTILNDWVIR